MEFARTHRGLILLIVLVDLASLAGLSWAPFDSHPGQTPLTDIVGVLSLIFHLLGYLLTVILLVTSPPIGYLFMFIVALVEWTLFAMAIAHLIAKLKSTQI